MNFFQRLFGINQQPCSDCKRLTQEKEDLLAKLFAEIDSNRLRENELLLLTLQTAKVSPAVGQRLSLSPPTNQQSEAVLTDHDLHSPKENEQLDNIIQQFIDEAETRGTPYTDEAKDILTETVYRNPERYI